jgi:hypothetical protein
MSFSGKLVQFSGPAGSAAGPSGKSRACGVALQVDDVMHEARNDQLLRPVSP